MRYSLRVWTGGVSEEDARVTTRDIVALTVTEKPNGFQVRLVDHEAPGSKSFDVEGSDLKMSFRFER